MTDEKPNKIEELLKEAGKLFTTQREHTIAQNKWRAVMRASWARRQEALLRLEEARARAFKESSSKEVAALGQAYEATADELREFLSEDIHFTDIRYCDHEVPEE